MTSVNPRRWDGIANVAKALAFLLIGLTLFALVAMRASNNVNPIRYADVSRYRAANIELKSARDSHRVVFIGDSITDFWDLKTFFSGQPYINRGIDGQTTSQMLLRFHQDVIDLEPQSVFILAGINDIGDGIPFDFIEGNYATMAGMARQNNIRVYFGSVLPVSKSKKGYPIRTIGTLNDWLRKYCDSAGETYVNFEGRMADADGFLLAKLSDDGLHPNADGYRVMQSVLAAVLASPPASPKVSKQ